MSTFDFIFALLSIVLGLAVTHMLGAVAQLVRAGDRVKVSLPHAIWMLTAFLLLVGNWLSLWQIRVLTDWSAASVLLTVLLAILQYLVCALVTPDVPAEGEIDLEAFNERERPRYISAMLAIAVYALIANTVYAQAYDIAAWGRDNMGVLATLPLIILPLVFKVRWVQVVAGVGLAGMTVLFLALSADAMT